MEIFDSDLVIVSVMSLFALNMVPYRKLRLPAAVFALALLAVVILSLHVVGGCSYSLFADELSLDGEGRGSAGGEAILTSSLCVV